MRDSLDGDLSYVYSYRVEVPIRTATIGPHSYNNISSEAASDHCVGNAKKTIVTETQHLRSDI